MVSVQDCLVSTTRLGRYLQREKTLTTIDADAIDGHAEKTAVKVEELVCRWPGNLAVNLAQPIARWWQLKYFLFSPLTMGKWSNLTNIFQMGWNHQLE